MKRSIPLAVLPIIFGLLACNLFIPIPPPGPVAQPALPEPSMPVPSSAFVVTGTPTAMSLSTSPTGAPFPVTPTASPPTTLTKQLLQNFTYRLPQSSKTVTLADGKFEGRSGPDFISALLLPQIAFGDLNGDGSEDAAVLIGENTGGSGVFVSLVAMLNLNGQPVQSASAFIDDRPRINALQIRAGELILDATIHAADDIMVQPTLSVLETYRLMPGGLTLMRFVSKTRDGSERRIAIESPPSSAIAGETVQVRGSMPIGPFENNLRLRVYDLNGNVLLEGPFGVKVEDMGAPATFDNPVDLSAIPAGTLVRLELAELSMREGSILSMDSVLLTRK